MLPACLDHFRAFSEKSIFDRKCVFRVGHFSVFGSGSRSQESFGGCEAVSRRTFQALVATRAVLAGVAEKPLKNRLEGLNVLDAVGPSFFRDRPPEESASHHMNGSCANAEQRWDAGWHGHASIIYEQNATQHPPTNHYPHTRQSQK